MHSTEDTLSVENDAKQAAGQTIHREKRRRMSVDDIVLHVLFILFGFGTWLNLNGIWIQLPLLVPSLPEGWSLSSQLGLASNFANVGPLIILLIKLLFGKSQSYEVPSICVIFLVGIIFPSVLSFTWSNQVIIFGQARSMYLLVIGFFLALVNCTSSVTYLPFVNRFDKKWLNIYFAGESLSSLVPAMLGLAQGVGGQPECVPIANNSQESEERYPPPRFSVGVYLFCLSFLMFISFVSFLILWQKQRSMKKETNENAQQLKETETSLLPPSSDENKVEQVQEKKKIDLETIIYLFLVLYTSTLLFGAIPSINAYSLNPYGAQTFHYVIIITQCCYPLVSLLASVRPSLFVMKRSRISISMIIGTAAFFYIMVTAAKSPCSPFVDSVYGSFIIGFVWILIYLIFYYARVALGNYFNNEHEHRGLFGYGLMTQIGAFIGAVTIFLLTANDVFQERSPCKNYAC